MDPLLQEKVQILYGKLARAKANGVEISQTDMENWLRRETGGKYGIADAQQYVSSLGEGYTSKNVLGSLGQGASFSFLDEAIGKLKGENAEAAERLRNKAFRGRHPYGDFALKLVGALAAPLALSAIAPETVGGVGAISLGRAALAGGLAGGATAAGESEAPDLAGRAVAGAQGAAAGAVLGPAATLGVRGAGSVVRGAADMLTDPAKLAVRRAGRLMPEGLEQQAARHEMLAPGTFMPAAATEDATMSATGLGANPRANLRAIELVRKKALEIKAAKDDVRLAYDQLGKDAGPLKVDNELRDLLHSVGEDYMGNTIGFEKLQKLRTLYREKANSATRSGDQHTFNEFYHGLTKWLNPKLPGLAEIDSRYAFLSRSYENAEKLFDVLSKTNATHGKVALYGGEAGTVGGHLPAGARGAVNTLLSKLTPNKSARAQGVMDALIQPADAAQVGRLAASREAAMAPPDPRPFSNFIAPAAGTDAIMSLYQMLSNPLPGGLQQPEQGQ